MLSRIISKIFWLIRTKEFKENSIRVLFRVIKYELYKLQEKPIQFSYDRNLEINIYPGDGAGRLVYYFDYHEPDQFLFLDRFLTKDMICVDIGANIGLYTLFMSKRVEKVFAFEPNEQSYIRLLENLQKNNISNVDVIQKAVTDKEGNIFLNLDEADSAKAYVSKEKKTTNKFYLVKTISVDQFFFRNTPSKIDYIKIDVEGAEPLVFSGAIQTVLKFRPLIQFEFAKKFENRFDDKNFVIKDYFDKINYVFYKIDPKSKFLNPGKGWNTIAIPSEKINELTYRGLIIN